MRIIFTLTFFCFLSLQVIHATQYYVDFNSGDDNQSGKLSYLPWKHCPGDENATGMPDTIHLKPGDIVLFKGGVEYKGEIRIKHDGLKGNPITYKGDGWGEEKAIIEGADLFSLNWTRCVSPSECHGNPYFDNIYYSEAPEGFEFFDGFYEDNQYLWFSQDPNPDERFNYDNIEGFYEIPMGRPFTTTSLTDSVYFTQDDPDYWKGSYLLVWHIPNVTTPRSITGFDPATFTITFEEIGGGGIYEDRNSYFSVLNHPVLIDNEGEYALDTSLHRIYLWPLSADHPNNHSFSCQRRLFGINYNHRKNLVIEGFVIRNSVMGIRTEYNDTEDIIIRNNEVRNLRSNNWYAVQVNGHRVTVENNMVEDCMRSVGILVAGDSMIIRNNYVKNTSRQGIWFMGVHHGSVINNVVTDIRGTHSNAISAYLYNEDILIAGNQVFNCNLGLTYHGESTMPELNMNLTVYNNYFEPPCHSWGNNARYITVINNTCKNGFFFYDTDTFTISINNIFHSGGDADLNRNNIYTDLGWWQRERYGWKLQEGEKDWSEKDINDIYLDIENDNFRLKEGSPAVDSGFHISNYLPVQLFPEYNFNKDVLNNPRIQGFSIDIGAHEYGDGSVVFSHCSINKNHFKIFPNPVSDQLNIEAMDTVTFELYNLTGRKLQEETENKIDMSIYPTGIYILQIKTSEGSCPVKFVKL